MALGILDLQRDRGPDKRFAAIVRDPDFEGDIDVRLQNGSRLEPNREVPFRPLGQQQSRCTKKLSQKFHAFILDFDRRKKAVQGDNRTRVGHLGCMLLFTFLSSVP